MPSIKINALSSEITKLMEEYADDVAAEMKEETKQIAKDTVAVLKKTSPKRAGGGKHYQSGWAVTTESEKSHAIGLVIHNKKKPGLTHLLEKGHAKRGGGRVNGKPHITPAEQQAVETYEKRLKVRLSR